MRAPARHSAALGTTQRRRGPSSWELLDADGTVLGRFGGRSTDRWAQLADGTDVTDGSTVSVDVLRSLLAAAAREARS